MNVTLNLPDELTKQARHLAIDEGKSLSGLVADLIRQRLNQDSESGSPPQSLADAMHLSGAPDWFYDKELPLPDRKDSDERNILFVAEE